jgi:hypothetical protein
VVYIAASLRRSSEEINSDGTLCELRKICNNSYAMPNRVTFPSLSFAPIGFLRTSFQKYVHETIGFLVVRYWLVAALIIYALLSTCLLLIS